MAKDDFFEKLGDFLDKGRQTIKDRLTLDITDLLRAIDQNDPDEVRRALRAGVNPNGRDGMNRLALTIATDNNIAEIVQLLLDAKADPNQKDPQGDTALYKAVYWENEAIIEMLLEAGADIHLATAKGITPLEEAKNNTNNNLEELLQSYQDEARSRQREADKAKHEEMKARAAKAREKRAQKAQKELEREEQRKQRAVEKEAKKIEKLYESKGTDYLRPLLKAMKSKDSDAVKLFAEKVDNIDGYDVFYNDTPLMMAIQMQSDKLAKFIIEKGADPINFIPKLRHSPLTKAVSLNRYKLVAFILKKYPDNIAEILNFEKHTLTPQFLAYKDARMMDLLVGAGADPFFGGQDIPSPVVKAIEKASIAILPVLAKHKVDLNQIVDGKTLLGWAIFYNRTDWVNGLLEEEADPRIKNADGQNALEYAQAVADREEIVVILTAKLKEY
jgi:ankyrin repeat protein